MKWFDFPRSRNGRTTAMALGLSLTSLVVGCGSAATPTSPISASPGALAQSTSPVPDVTATPGPTATSAPTVAPLLHVGLAPTGAWNAIAWADVRATFPPMPVDDRDTFDARVFGWSRGYLAFAADGGSSTGSSLPATISATSSDDGVSWSAPHSIDLAGLDDRIDVAAVVEGPAGLLMVGDYRPGTCGGPPWVAALWTSVDGRSWQRVQLPKTFTASRVETVDAGSAGYIASGTSPDGVTPTVWVSPDGRSWHPIPVGGPTFGKVIVNGATSFAGGYVIAGARLGPDGCGGATSLTPSLWWSADGNAWTRSSLTGASPAADASMTVSRISDRALVAIASTYHASSDSTTKQVWLSADGRRWTPIATPSDLIGSRILTDGTRGVIVVDPIDPGPQLIATVGDDLTVTVLEQSGSGPRASESEAGWTSALGPTGIVVLSVDGSKLWLGVPSAP